MTDALVMFPDRLVGTSLTVAGLAIWVFQHCGDGEDAERCCALQDALDGMLIPGPQSTVLVDRPVVEESAQLWEKAARLLDEWAQAQPGRNAAEGARQARRLRARARSLRDLLDPVDAV